MRGLRPSSATLLAVAASMALAAPAAPQAPLQLTLPGQSSPKPVVKSAPKPAAKPPSRKPVQPVQKEPAPAAARAALPAPQPGMGREVDLAYGAYQRGLYITAFALATRRVEERSEDVRMLSSQAKRLTRKVV